MPANPDVQPKATAQLSPSAFVAQPEGGSPHVAHYHQHLPCVAVSNSCAEGSVPVTPAAHYADASVACTPVSVAPVHLHAEDICEAGCPNSTHVDTPIPNQPHLQVQLAHRSQPLHPNAPPFHPSTPQVSAPSASPEDNQPPMEKQPLQPPSQQNNTGVATCNLDVTSPPRSSTSCSPQAVQSPNAVTPTALNAQPNVLDSPKIAFSSTVATNERSVTPNRSLDADAQLDNSNNIAAGAQSVSASSPQTTPPGAVLETPIRRLHSPASSQDATLQLSEAPPAANIQVSSPSYGSKMAAARATATGVEATSVSASAVSERAHGGAHGVDENRPPQGGPNAMRGIQSDLRVNFAGPYPPVAPRGRGKPDVEPYEMDRFYDLVAKIKAPVDGNRPRPLICQDITNSNADTLRISRVPRGVTYDQLYSLVEPFGEVEDLVWTAADPYVCDVTYRDSAAASEAKHFLNDAIIGSDSEAPLKAELRSRDPGAQLFVGDLTPDVTEEMLEDTFSELVGEPVNALLKRDLDSLSPIGYGFLSFKSESSANLALVAGHRAKIGNACVRVGRAERNTYLYVSDLAGNVSMDELKQLFGKFGNLVEEDTAIVRRSYAFIRYKNRGSAEKAKRTLDKTELKGRLSVRYAEAEPLKACVAVQFHSSVPRPPNSLRDLLSATFSKHGNCSVEIPRLQNGMWRKVAFVTFHGEPIAANLAALEAVQSIRFVSSLPVCCQFARELIPRLPSRGISGERMLGGETDRVGGSSGNGGGSVGNGAERGGPRNLPGRKHGGRRTDSNMGDGNGNGSRSNFFDRRGRQYANDNVGSASGSGNGANAVGGGNGNGNVGGAMHGNGDFVPVYVPIAALQQHPNGSPMGPSASGVGPGGVGPSDVAPAEFSGFHPWSNRMMMPNTTGPQAAAGNMPHVIPGMNGNFSPFAPPMQDRLRW